MTNDVVGSIVDWLVAQVGSAGVAAFRRGPNRRALEQAVDRAVEAVLAEVDAGARDVVRGELARCFTGARPLTVAEWEGDDGPRDAIAERLAGLRTLEHAATHVPFTEVAGVSVDWLAERFADALPRALREVVAAAGAPEYVRHLDFLAILRRFDDLGAKLAPSCSATAADEFTERYRKYMANVLDRFEFFGVSTIERRHRFESGYVTPTLNERDPAADAAVSVGVRADDAVLANRLALVRGVAGSGKTTLLRWLGWQAARSERTEAGAIVPFLVELSTVPGGRPPALRDLLPQALRDQGVPDTWLARVLSGDQVLLLLDGLDEVPARDRGRLEDWVQEHLHLYENIRCVVTTRPSVVAEQWWVDENFARFNLLPMSRHSIEQYVHGWHEAARADQPDTDDGSEMRAELHRCEPALLRTLSDRPALRGMSANPLLCGLLCALFLERREHLPESRRLVYDEALALLGRWRHLRHKRQVAHRNGRSSASVPPLSDEELQKLFQRIAFWMVTNRQLILPADTAERRMKAFLSGMRNAGQDPAAVLEYVAQDSGLLRQRPDRALDFLHRTFRDHLAAKEVVEEENLGLMLESADKPYWHDVVVMAGAHARPGERNHILRVLLERGRAEPQHQDALYLLAAAILEQAVVLAPPDADSPDLRALVQEAISQLIPPATSAAADQLAAAGEFVLDLLPGPDDLAAAPAELVVRAVARIAAQWNNPPGAVEKILQFTDGRLCTGILTQLLEPWGRLGDYESYGRNVLAEIDFSRCTVNLPAGKWLDHIGHLRTLTRLRLRNDQMNLQPLAALPRLHRLTLVGNTTTELDTATGAGALRTLVLERCSSRSEARPVDLCPVHRLALRRLVITGLRTKVDLAGLAGADLVSLRVDARAVEGATLPSGLRVRHLTLGRRVRIRARGVRSVILARVPDEDDLADLAALPELRRLVLYKVAPDTPAPILPGVRVLIWPTGTR